MRSLSNARLIEPCLQIIIAMTAQRYRLSLTPGCRVEPDPGLTLRPRHGLPVILHRADRPEPTGAAAHH